jgi:hypothetical protein
MGDLYLVYQPWAQQAAAGLGIVGITEPWVYPQLALVPIMLANALAGVVGYEIGWVIVVTVADALAFAVLVGRGRSTGRTVAAWFWVSFIAVLGPVGMYRLDAVTVPLALAGSLWLVGRPWIGSMLLAIGTWIKVWPAALILAAVVAVRRRLAVLGGALAVSVATLVVVAVAGGWQYAFGFVSEQTGRGLQIEAPVTAFYLWRAVLYVPGSQVFYSPDIHTFEVTGPGVDAVIAAMTPLLVIAIVAVAAVGAYKAWRGASFAALFPTLALAVVTGFIVFNKVGSPQYLTWIIAPLAVGLVIDRHSWWRPATLGLAMGLVTQIVYPILYGGMMLEHPLALPTVFLTLRNLMMTVLFFWMVVRLLRVPVAAARRSRATVSAPVRPVADERTG